MKIIKKLLIHLSVSTAFFMSAYISQQERALVLGYCQQVASKLEMLDVVFDVDTDELDDSLVVADYTIDMKRVRVTDMILEQLLEHIQNNSINFALFTLFHECGHHVFYTNSQNFFNNNFLSERHADRFAIQKLCDLYGHQEVQEFLEHSYQIDPARGHLFSERALGRKGYQGYDKLLRYCKSLEKKALARKEPLDSFFYVNHSI